MLRLYPLPSQTQGRLLSPQEKRTPRRPEKNQDHHSQRQKSNVYVLTPTPTPTYRWDCALCKPEKHPLYLCPKWLEYSVAQRLSHIQARNLCQNCLGVGHDTSSCKSTYKCRECQQSHHTTIHQSTPPPTSVNTVSVASSQVPDALRMTAQVLLAGPGGKKTQARALIDPGAGASLVSSRIAQLLHLPLTNTSTHFSGVQGTPCKSSDHLTNLSLSPLQSNQHQVTVKAAVVSTVTNDLPAQESSPIDELHHLSGLFHPSTHQAG